MSRDPISTGQACDEVKMKWMRHCVRLSNANDQSPGLPIAEGHKHSLNSILTIDYVNTSESQVMTAPAGGGSAFRRFTVVCLPNQPASPLSERHRRKSRLTAAHRRRSFGDSNVPTRPWYANGTRRATVATRSLHDGVARATRKQARY